MTKKQVWVLIIGAAIVGGVTQAAGLYPQYKEILVAANLLVTTVMAFVSKPPSK